MTCRQVMSEPVVEPVMTVTCLDGTSRTELYRFAATPLNEVRLSRTGDGGLVCAQVGD